MRSARAGDIHWRGYLGTLLLVGLATALGAVGRGRLATPDVVMLYLLVIGVSAAVFGRGPSWVASVGSVLAYDFFFVPPFYTFTVENERHLLTFATMFIVGWVMSALTLRIRREVQQAQAREARTAALYSLSRDLGASLDEEQAALAIARHATELFGGGAVVLLPDRAGALVPRATTGSAVELGPGEMAAVSWAFEQGRNAGATTDILRNARALSVPLRSGVQTLGVLALSAELSAPPSLEQAALLDAFARQSALAIARARFAEEAKLAILRARTEEMRSSLLSSVSHDLRTPLAAITGAATTLRGADAALTPGQRTELLDTVCEEAERLEHLVRNLLDMTRLDSGAIEVKRDWVPIEEMVGSSLARVEAHLAGRRVETTIDTAVPLVSVDPVLMEQVFVNLLENAAKHTPLGTPIQVNARPGDHCVEVEIADRGPGLPPGSEARIFEKFFRGSPRGSGAGLGLAICRGIVAAHGGTIGAENRQGGGAVFRFRLPHTGDAPSVPEEQEPDESPSRKEPS